jgi:hypothetical protein
MAPPSEPFELRHAFSFESGAQKNNEAGIE